ncbi:alpha-ketoglutarate-dependent dioxygenase alkB homolog 4 [Musca vetustissima]|uniref:alpha-ketoglutarate-dependent dioxygenase alkB homolog 4 n=1 Tax=Musca vetustissima TaxID=27455 RepID=UPI002AB74125|nr:alpha-ketoglutarate-dependent dioxygenase alkB homolog 4 [Musca vetustissima]
MNTIRPCGCKGVRTCLKCEQDFGIEKPNLKDVFEKLDAWSWCIKCEKLYPGWNTKDVQEQHPEHMQSSGLNLPGIVVQTDFISPDEGQKTMDDLDALPWCISQSGRRKQNFGPKTNFKKRKVQNGTFQGFPKVTKYIQEKLNAVPLLNDFQTIEQCSLEYDPTKGASIDPHIDDCWIWGERVVTVNCLGDSVLTLNLYKDCLDKPLKNIPKYNLELVPIYEHQLLEPLMDREKLKIFENKIIRIPMPCLSLIVLYGPARYQFEHSVLREDIQERRVCLAYREFTPMYLEGGQSHDKGVEILRNSKNCW